MKRLLAAAPLLLTACAVHPPAHWAQGGAEMEIPFARWVRGETTVVLLPDGKVQVNGDHVATLDRAGRLYDADNQPVALLEPDGRVTGPDETPLGFVGQGSASLPGARTAWLVLAPSGEITRYDEEGSPSSMGVWVGGCLRTPRSQQACMLITHVVGMRQQNSPQLSMGVGVSVGFGVRR